MNDLRDAQLRELTERAERLTAELEHLRDERAAMSEHRQRESQLQRSMLAALQAERAALIDEIQALKEQLHVVGADSARIALRRALTMLGRAVKRRLGFKN